MRISIFILMLVSVPLSSFADDDLEVRATLNEIHKVQKQNVVRIRELAFTSVAKLEWSNPRTVEVARQTSFWRPEQNKFLATDPFPDDEDRSWKKRPVCISKMFGGLDERHLPWQLFDDYPDELLEERVTILDTSDETKSYEITAFWSAGEGQPNLFVKFFVNELNCFYPHRIVCKGGFAWENARLEQESKHSYERIKDTFVPKSGVFRFYEANSQDIQRQITVTVEQLWLNPQLESDVNAVEDLINIETKLSANSMLIH